MLKQLQPYLLAIASTAGAILLRVPLHYASSESPFLLLTPAVVLSLWQGGILSGALSMALALGWVHLLNTPHLLSTLSFIFQNLLLGWLILSLGEARHGQAVCEVRSDELEQLNQAKDDFAQAAWHDLKVPLTNIRMAVEVLSRSGIEVAQRDRCLKILDSEVGRAIDLVNELLELQRLVLATEVVNPTLVPLGYWLPHILESFEHRVGDRQQSLILDIPADLPSIHIDAEHLQRIISELVNNACKYTPPGEKIFVTAQARNEAVQVSVINTGVEIPAEELPRIFDKFYRVPGGDKFRQGGTGLGLAIIKGLVELLRGSIQVASSEGKVQFLVQIPLN